MLWSCGEGKEISYCFANLNLLIFRHSLLSPLLKLPNDLIWGNLNGVLIFSEFEQILAIKMAPICRVFNKGQQRRNSPAISHELATYFSLEITPVFFK